MTRHVLVAPNANAFARFDWDAREGRWRRTEKGPLAHIMPAAIAEAGGCDYTFSSHRPPPKRPDLFTLPPAGTGAVTTIYLPTGNGIGAQQEWGTLTYFDACATPVPGKTFFPFRSRHGLQERLAEHLNPQIYAALLAEPRKMEVWLRTTMTAHALAPGVFEVEKCTADT